MYVLLLCDRGGGGGIKLLQDIVSHNLLVLRIDVVNNIPEW